MRKLLVLMILIAASSSAGCIGDSYISDLAEKSVSVGQDTYIDPYNSSTDDADEHTTVAYKRTHEYQDSEWDENFFAWAELIAPNLESLNTSIANKDFTRVKSVALDTQYICDSALKDSQKYEVSPSLKYEKNMHETGLKELLLATDYIEKAMIDYEKNDLDSFNSNLQLANDYRDRGETHLLVALIALKFG
ncbi:MAG: hypothetical protein PWQ75_2438 [Methanolobus sp.]|jgi:hypothetical protein|nr:hypothetical protein [Methanolobus sp.]